MLTILIFYTLLYPKPKPPSLLPSINIPIAQIPSIFQSGPASDLLQSIAIQNSNLNNFIFYTDGSVTNIGSPQCSMGIGWLQLNNDLIQYTF